MLDGYERDFGYPVRVRIDSVEELSQMIAEHDGVNPCFLSVSYYQNETPFLAFIPFDFDGKIDRVLKDTNNLEKDLIDNNIPYEIRFSGSRGTHVIIPIDFDIGPCFVSPKTLRDIQMTLIIRNKLETVDYHLVGNINALLRIPDTINEKSKKPCLVLRESDGRTISISELCKRLDVKEFKYNFGSNETFYSHEDLHPYPCLECFIKMPNPLNYCRVAFTLYRIKQGKTIQEIVDEIKSFEWVDFEESKTEYYIQKIRTRVPAYSMCGCKKLKQHGLCLGEDCKYDDLRINDFVKVINGECD